MRQNSARLTRKPTRCFQILARLIGILKSYLQGMHFSGLRVALLISVVAASPWQRVSAQSVIPPYYYVTSIYTLLPDGTKSPILLLNQNIGVDITFEPGWCDPANICTDLQASDGWRVGPYSFHAAWTGGAQVTNLGNDVCGDEFFSTTSECN